MSNALLDFVKQHTSAGKNIDMKKKYDQINSERQEQGKPPLPPYDDWVKSQGK